MHQTRLQVKRTFRLRIKANWNLSENKTCLKRETHFKRKIANVKIYEDKRDLYCSGWVFDNMTWQFVLDLLFGIVLL